MGAITKRIAILDSSGSLHDGKIGATNSIMRRICFDLRSRELAEINFVDIGSGDRSSKAIRRGIKHVPFPDFEEAMKYLKMERFDHVLSIYIKGRDRLRYAVFRAVNKKLPTKFHTMYFSWPDNLLKRELSFMDSRIYPYNGRVLCVSPRQYKKVRKWARKSAALLLPPIPDSYFISENQKTKSDKIRVSWLGRLDPGKGADLSIKLLRKLAKHKDFKVRACGHRWDSCRETKDLQRWLIMQDEFEYIDLNYTDHNEKIESFVGQFFAETDIYISPYRKLSSTIDTPMLIQEAIASLAIVITKPFGDIHWLYGNKTFLLANNNKFIDDAEELIHHIKNVRSILTNERSRLAIRREKLGFKTSKISDKFIKLIEFDPNAKVTNKTPVNKVC